jgi:hypothetical protein
MQESNMDVHDSQKSMSLVNPYSAAAEKVAAAQRAAAVRKKLLKSAATIKSASISEETSEDVSEDASKIGRWADMRNPIQNVAPYRDVAPIKNPAFI